MKTRQILATFNRGVVSSKALARVDVSRVALSAALQTNWMARALGPMSLRPGLEYIETSLGDGVLMPFIFDDDDYATLEFTPDHPAGKLRILDNGETLVTRNTVPTTIANGGFNTDLSSWIDNDETGATSTWATGGYMQLLGTGTNSARRYQSVSVSAGDQNTEHGIRIVMHQGKCLLRIGTTLGDDDIFPQSVIRKGKHSIAFTPGAATIYIQFESALSYPVLVDSVSMEAGGTLELPHPWTTAERCKALRWDQSGDTVFIAGGRDFQQMRVERRENNSWSIVNYETEDGPWQIENTDRITLTPSALSGAITITASRPTFRSTHVGSLYKIASNGQRVETDAAAELVFTDAIRVTGIATERNFLVGIAGTWSGSISLQRSVGAPGSWVTIASYTTNWALGVLDGLPNTIAYYRLGIEAGNYTSGTAEMSLEISSGSITGVARVTGYTSNTSVDAIVLKDMGGTEASENWAAGAWSDEEGWPEAGVIWEGRMWWQANGRNYGSSSDTFDVYDPDIEGDSAPINRLIGDGPVSRAKWAIALQRLIVGTGVQENAIRSNNFDEPVTASNYNSKHPSTKGSANVPAVVHDDVGYFVDNTQRAIYEMRYSAEKYDYNARDMTEIAPEITDNGVVRLGVQNRPDMRLHAALSDGTAAILIHDEAEDVKCWLNIETDGVIEDVVVLPGIAEDSVYYRIRRTIDGNTVRYIEKWAREDQCVGGDVNRQADSFVVGTGAIAGLNHLEGEEVVIWADGQDRGTATISAGAVVNQSYSNWCVGLGYQARFKSAKLAAQTQLGFSLTKRSRIHTLGLILENTHAQGLRYGPDFETLDDLPVQENEADVDENAVWSQYDEDGIEFPGDWDTDGRICLEANAPRPATVLAAVMEAEVDAN